MKKKTIIIPIIIIILIITIGFWVFKLIKGKQNNKTTILTGEIIEVLDKGYKIEVDNLEGKETFVNVTVNYDNSNFKVKDYIKVTGNNLNIKKNSFDATNIIKTSYIEEYSPTIKSKELGNIQAQYGYIITLDKIELSEKETRLYITVSNKGNSKIELLVEKSLITQNEKEYKYQPNIKAKYLEIEKQISSPKESKGIITFPKLEDGTMKIKLEVTSNNNEEKTEDYIFDIGI